MVQTVDPSILRKLVASVDHYYGPRKNTSFVITVETMGTHNQNKERSSSQSVTRSFHDFRQLHKSLQSRVHGKRGTCSCQGRGECAFSIIKTFLDRLRFSRMPLFGFVVKEENIANRQLEMNNFLQIIFAILHRMNSSSWRKDCLFLQDILVFLDVEQTFQDQVEEFLKQQSRHMNLRGWKAHHIKTYGHGIQSNKGRK